MQTKISGITSDFVLINPFEKQDENNTTFPKMYNLLTKMRYFEIEENSIYQIIILKVDNTNCINKFFKLLNNYGDLLEISEYSYTNNEEIFTIQYDKTIIQDDLAIIPIYMNDNYFTSIIIRSKNKEENYSTATDNIYIVNIIIGNIPILTLAEYIDKLDSNNFASLRCLFTKCIQFREELQSVKVYNIDDSPDPKYPQTTNPPKTSKHERRTS